MLIMSNYDTQTIYNMRNIIRIYIVKPTRPDQKYFIEVELIDSLKTLGVYNSYKTAEVTLNLLFQAYRDNERIFRIYNEGDSL